MSDSNHKLIEKFYTAFQNKDAEGMIECYHPEIIFQDPVFGELKGAKARNMWRMLVKNGGEDLKVTFSDIQATNEKGQGKWEAKYVFGKQKRKVHNRISSQFTFKDEKIYRHLDSFNFWRWSRMALGPLGFWLGLTPFLKNSVRRQSLKTLEKFSEKYPESSPPELPDES